jgi:PIN domain nuclease of toxin-antitoxin system
VDYLLDTHIWLWLHGAPEKLSAPVTKALQNSENPLWVSPVSFWEILLLVEKGRLDLGFKPLDWFEAAAARVPVRDAWFTLEVAKELPRVNLPHRDPADRFLVATARVYELTLITADERLFGVKGLSVLPNRPA